MAAARAGPPCSHTTSRPRASIAMPLAALASATTVSTRTARRPSSTTRRIATSREPSGRSSGTLVKYRTPVAAP
jgi:hypothetical protein